MDINTAPRSELVRLIYELSDRIAVLEAENAHLREQLQQKRKNNAPFQPSIPVKPSTPKKRLKEKKNRDKAFTRGRETPTEKVFHAANTCQGCSGTLGKPTVLYTRQVIDVPCQKFLEEIRKSPFVHGDETGGRENGKNGYYWSFSTPTIHVLLYRKSRGSKIVEELTGEESDKFNGVMVSDFYAAYNTYTGFHQRCWVHLLRDIHNLKEEYKGRHPPLNLWTAKIKRIYKEANSYPGPDPSLPAGIQAQQRINKQQEFENRLRKLCQPYLAKESPMSTLCGRIITFLPELFVFIRFPNIPSNNNHAEKILRHTVTARKIHGGTRSAKGSETRSILTSLFDTWVLQGKNPLHQCRLLLAGT